MNKKHVLILLAALLLSLGSSYAAPDDTPVVQAGQSVISQEDAQAFFDATYAQYVAYLEQNGVQMPQSFLEEIRDSVMQELVHFAVLDNAAAKANLDTVTDADRDALRAEVQTRFDDLVAQEAEAMGITRDAARDRLHDMGISAESIYEEELKYLIPSRLYDMVSADITVSQEEIEASFAPYLEGDKAQYENNAPNFEMCFYSHGLEGVFYIPEGYRFVKMIRLPVSADVSAQMLDLQTDIEAVQFQLVGFGQQLVDLESAEEADDRQRGEQDIRADIAQSEEALNALYDQYEEAREQILPSLQPVIDEIIEQLSQGADFDKLIAVYGDRQEAEAYPEGYLMHRDSFMLGMDRALDFHLRDAAMALKAVGDVTDPLIADDGVYIFQYTGDLAGGPIEFTDEVAATIGENLLNAKRDEAFAQAYQTWLESVEVQTHPELIVLPEILDVYDFDQPGQTPPADENDESNEDGSVG